MPAQSIQVLVIMMLKAGLVLCSEDGDSDGEESDKSQGEAPSEPRQQGSRAQKQLPIPGKLVTSKAKLAARKSRRPVRSDHKGQKRRKPQKPEQKSGKVPRLHRTVLTSCLFHCACTSNM